MGFDTIVSSFGKGCLAAFVERQTRFYVALKVENRSALEMYRKCIYAIYSIHLKHIRLIEEKGLPTIRS